MTKRGGNDALHYTCILKTTINATKDVGNCGTSEIIFCRTKTIGCKKNLTSFFRFLLSACIHNALWIYRRASLVLRLSAGEEEMSLKNNHNIERGTGAIHIGVYLLGKENSLEAKATPRE